MRTGIFLLFIVIFGFLATAQEEVINPTPEEPIGPEELGEVECPEGLLETYVNGLCHNIEFPIFGRSNQLELRFGVPRFGDGQGALDNDGRPNPREVSNRVVQQPVNIDMNPKRMTRLLIFIGQFIDHDMTITPEQEGDEEEAEFANILVPEGDDRFEPGETIEFRRSETEIDPNSRVREFISGNTAWLDLGSVYGDTIERLELVRDEGNAGRLLVSVAAGGEFPPLDELGLSICGDIRCEENIMLFAFHTLFLREHNRLAALFLAQNAGAADELVFQTARLLNIIQYQSIVWDSYLPYLLGRRSFEELTGEYRGPQLGVDPTVSVFFGAAVYRYGHSGVSNDLRFTDVNGNQLQTTIALADAFGAIPGAIDEALKEDAVSMPAIFAGQSILAHPILDSFVVSGIRDELLANAPERRDLVALNMQRGRDHGIQDLNHYREMVGLPRYECDGTSACFRLLTGEETIADELFALYGTIEMGDAWVLGMAEVPREYPDSQLGDTFTMYIAEQFNRFRNGDRIWYENVIEELEEAELLDLQFPARMRDPIVNNLAADLPGLEMLSSSFSIESVYVAYAGADRFQVEWVIPQELREVTITQFEVEVAGPGINEDFNVAPDQLYLYLDEDITPESTYEVTVTAQIAGQQDNTFGSVEFQTVSFEEQLPPLGELEQQDNRPREEEDNRIAGLEPGAFYGIVFGSIGGVALIAVVAVLIIRRSRQNQDFSAALF